MNGPPPGITDYEMRMIQHILTNKWRFVMDFNSFPFGISREKMDAVFEKWERLGYARLHRDPSSGRLEIDQVEITRSLEFYVDELRAGGNPLMLAQQVNVNIGRDLNTGGHFVAGPGHAGGNVSNTRIHNEADLQAAIRALVGDLRREARTGCIEAADELGRACTAASKVEVAAALEKAVKHKPELLERLRELAMGTASSLAGNALFEGLKFILP